MAKNLINPETPLKDVSLDNVPLFKRTYKRIVLDYGLKDLAEKFVANRLTTLIFRICLCESLLNKTELALKKGGDIIKINPLANHLRELEGDFLKHVRMLRGYNPANKDYSTSSFVDIVADEIKPEKASK